METLGAGMVGFAVICLIISLIPIITFFVMAVALHNISLAVRNTDRIITAWSLETGIGMTYKCAKCKKNYEGKKAICPHCGDPKTY